MKILENIEEKVIDTYKWIEDRFTNRFLEEDDFGHLKLKSKAETRVVATYKKIEDTFVNNYQKIENSFVETFLKGKDDKNDFI